MDRLEQLREVVDEIVRKNPDHEQCRCGYVHLYIWNYQFGEDPEHANFGAVEAQKILRQVGTFTPDEVETICTAIAQHSDKQSISGEMAELLKDADVFQHYLYNPAMYVDAVQDPTDTRNKSGHILRLKSIMSELGINLDLD